MAKIQINNPRQTINGGAKKYYFKVKGLGGPKGDKGDKGDTGSRGPQGEPGNAATVYVGSTTTLPVGQDATVENVGTQYNAVLNFGIPQGPRGPQGIQGERGEPGQTGQTGPRGPQGERGTNATVYVGTTTTTNPGTQARVYNSGTDSNAVLNFEIPRGDVGPQPELVQTTGTSTTKAMSQNATTSAINAGLATKQNTLTAGANIQISSDTISATDTTYTAGNGLNLNGTEFSADTTVLATKSDLGGYYTKPETDNLLAPKLEAEVVSALPATGTEGKLYLTPKAHTTQTATGNPITATVAEEAGKIESFQLDGDTEQQSYTGKNLANPEPRTTASNGLLASYNESTGEITVSGTATATWSNPFASGLPLQAGTYTLSQTGELTHGLLGVSAAGRTFAVDASTKKVTFSLGSDAASSYIWIAGLQNGNVVSGTITAQLESGSAATTFEKYTGGQASPNPDYPQNIQVVTGKQTVKVLGKNLLNITSPMREVTKSGLHITIADDGKITIDGTATGASWPDFIWGIQSNTGSHNSCKYYFPKALEAVTYSIKIVNGTVTDNPSISVVFNDDGGKNVNIRFDQPQVKTVTGVNGINRAYLTGVKSGTTFNNFQFYLQIESGTTATEVVPYSELDYEIDLGDIELCKLGTYQDYIYKDGSDWKVHNTIRKTIVNGGETWEAAISLLWGSNTYACSSIKGYKPWSPTKSDRFIDAELPQAANIQSGYMQMAGFSWVIRIDSVTSVAELKTWLSSNNVNLYYVLATATDTTITDQTLIAQLEAIRTASLQNGANTITNTATGSNLAGDMEVGYYGYNPTNRYDKWLWLDINNNYEQIGS